MNFDLTFYWGLIIRRLPIMMALFLFCAVAATLIATRLAPVYTTSALLLVEEPQIPDALVTSLTRTNADQQLQVIERQLLTRANLLDVARKFDVFENAQSMSPDEIVDGMLKQTRIRRSGGRNQATLMNVSFTGRNPQLVSDVVNEYVTLVLEESSDFRLDRAENTLSFFEQEVERLSVDLDIQSGQIIKFKNENTNALPDDLAYRQGRQSILQERIARLERDIADVKTQRQEIIAVYEATGRLNGSTRRSLTRDEQQLEALRLELEEALVVYSATNPRVKLLQSRIAQLEKRVIDSAPTNEASDLNGTGPEVILELTLAEIDQRIVNMEQEHLTISEELQQLEASILETAGNAISLNALERDFENIQAQYNAAISNLNSARMNERIEVTAQGQRISVIEGANVPQKPSGPNKLLIVMAGGVSGLVLAVAFFVLLELLNGKIRRPVELKEKFGIVPIAIIPYMETQHERMIRRVTIAVAFLLVLVCVPAGLYFIDANYAPLDSIARRLLATFGLT